MKHCFAAVDIGSNATRLLIGHVKTEGEYIRFKKIFKARRALNLGGSVYATGNISSHQIEQLVATLDEFAYEARNHRVIGLRICATAAFRDARNSAEVLNQLTHSGHNVEILEGHQEAHLVGKALQLNRTLPDDKVIHLDLGGGSTEVNILDDRKVIASNSFPIGTARLADMRELRDELVRMRAWTEQVASGVPAKVTATGGSIRKIHDRLGLEVHQAVTLDRLAVLSAGERSLRVGEDKSSRMQNGAIIYRQILAALGRSEIFVSSLGLSHGIICELATEYFEL